MAWLDCETRTGIYQIGFTFGGHRFKRSLRTRDEQAAEATLHRVEENLRLVATGRLVIPADSDIPSFLISDGRISAKTCLPNQLTLDSLFERYTSSIPSQSLAPETLRVCEIHMNHVVRIIGPRKQLRTVKRDDLQQFVNHRAQEVGKRGKPVSPSTIRKELSTFRTLWRWAKHSELVTADFPNQGVRFPRQTQKHPFLTWEQIETRIRRGLPDGQSEADLWDCLYLSKAELEALLDDIEKLATYEFLFPMSVMAAYTGARRSELCRCLRDDIDFESDAILIREKKRQKGRETFRHVPMAPRLREVLSHWLGQTMLSAYTFPAEHRVSRVRNSKRRENSESVSPDEVY